MNLELISPLLHYAGALDDLEEIFFEKELRAFERELDGFGLKDREAIAKPVWGASPGIIKPKTLKRKRTRVKAMAKTVQTRGKLKVKKTAKKRRAVEGRQASKLR